MLKLFVDKDANQAVAVNPAVVSFVRDTNNGTKIFFDDRTFLIVTDSFRVVIARLNERNM